MSIHAVSLLLLSQQVSPHPRQVSALSLAESVRPLLVVRVIHLALPAPERLHQFCLLLVLSGRERVLQVDVDSCVALCLLQIPYLFIQFPLFIGVGKLRGDELVLAKQGLIRTGLTVVALLGRK